MLVIMPMNIRLIILKPWKKSIERKKKEDDIILILDMYVGFLELMLISQNCIKIEMGRELICGN